MSRTSKAMKTVRRVVDHAMIFASLAVLAWPWFRHDLADRDTGAFAWAGPLTVVALGGAALARASRRWPLAQYAPAAAAMLTAAVLNAGPADDREVTWLIITVAAVLLVRQLLGVRPYPGFTRDLSRQRPAAAQPGWQDPLTRLGNRTMFLDHAQDVLDQADDTMTAVVVIDLDGFQEVNDTYGHAVGDELLKTTAARLTANVRAADQVSRLGGDEFVVLLPGLTDDTIADTVANRILRDLLQPLVVGDAMLSVRASAGIAVTRGGDVDEVMRDARHALQQAKAEGRGIARRFDPAQFARTEQRRHDEQELRQAFADEQFEVHYQPIVDLAGEHTVGVEALIRWRHPTRGLLAPAAFLDLAEELGMLPELGHWVLHEACQQAVRWQQHTPTLELNVNLSASQLGNPALCDEVRAVLVSTGIPPRQLVLELTETVALTDLVESARVLNSLKALGVRIALDDFGTGFSSLSHLGVLPVDVVKIDKSFVQAMQDSGGASVAEAVLQIARTFNLAPVAEGVEDAVQATRLRELECAQAQGYHFARPMPAGDLTDLLTRQAALVA